MKPEILEEKYYQDIAQYKMEEAFALRYNYVAYVEYKTDKAFWQSFFKEEKILIDYITLTQKGNKTSGSGQCLLFKKYGLLNKHFFICLDSDYNYLLQTPNFNLQSFVFQTYTYAIENHFCYEARLNELVAKLTNEKIKFDFSLFLTQYSILIFSLLCYSLLHEKEKMKDIFTRYEFASQITSFTKKDLNLENNGEFILQEIESKVKQIQQQLDESGLYSAQLIENAKQNLANLGINEHNAYLYIRGHHLQERLIEPILDRARHLAKLQLPHSERNTLPTKPISHYLSTYFSPSTYHYVAMQNIQNDIHVFFS